MRVAGAAWAIATAIAPEPVPTSTTRAGPEPTKSTAAATSCSVAGRGVITRPGLASRGRPLKVTSCITVFVSPAPLFLLRLERLLAADERTQALVLLTAG